MLRADNSAATLSRDEWRTVRIGAWVVAMAIVVAALMPLARTWSAREARLTAARARVVQLSGVVDAAPSLDQSALKLESYLASQPTRVLRARSRTLAASALQSLVQEMADASNVTVTRLDVASVSASGGDLPITLSANGDIYGVASLLQKFRQGRQVVVLDKLTLQVNSALRGAPDVLQMTMSLHAPVIVE
jgi:hypothetical protein